MQRLEQGQSDIVCCTRDGSISTNLPLTPVPQATAQASSRAPASRCNGHRLTARTCLHDAITGGTMISGKTVRSLFVAWGLYGSCSACSPLTWRTRLRHRRRATTAAAQHRKILICKHKRRRLLRRGRARRRQALPRHAPRLTPRHPSTGRPGRWQPRSAPPPPPQHGRRLQRRTTYASWLAQPSPGGPHRPCVHRAVAAGQLWKCRRRCKRRAPTLKPRRRRRAAGPIAGGGAPLAVCCVLCPWYSRARWHAHGHAVGTRVWHRVHRHWQAAHCLWADHVAGPAVLEGGELRRAVVAGGAAHGVGWRHHQREAGGHG